MATFKILIKGIAMVYHKVQLDQQWQVILPFKDRFDSTNKCHDIKFFGYMSKQETLAGPNRKITFEAEGLTGKFNEGANYHSFVNITGTGAHTSGIKTRKDWNQYGVLMTIPGADFSVYESSLCNYKLVDGNGVTTFGPNTIGYYGQAVITARALTVLVDDKPLRPAYTSSTSLLFDNNCYEYAPMSGPSDFRMIYSIVDPVSGDFREIKRDPSQLPINLFTNAEGKDFLGQPVDEKYVGVPLIPLNSPIPNPRPFEYGLPCHMLTVGDPGDLP